MASQCVLFTARASFIAPHRVTCIQHFQAVLPLPKRYVGIIQNPTVLNQFKCMSLTSQGRHYVPSVPVKPVRSSHSAVVRDVVLFEHDRTRFFRLLALFCGGQFLFWTYLAYFAFTGLRDTRKSSKEPQKVRTELGLFSFDMNLGSNTWRFGFTLGCIVVGGGIVGLGMLFSRRSVSRVVLHKGGGKVTVCTQSPLGVSNAWHLTVPLNQVACHAHRQESPSFIPLKVKNHKFYFLLDKEGNLNNPKLFDVTVGAYRPL
ncbi:transmembrane protein 223 [Neoarius graeffei]|uniref:transmembrane protein 223 n=1 Tax=Neoarius graeffei TaxID=443677 RepID=UPI00298BD53F|nr:transmembrane protein 223 [Neoarius graeffei]